MNPKKIAEMITENLDGVISEAGTQIPQGVGHWIIHFNRGTQIECHYIKVSRFNPNTFYAGINPQKSERWIRGGPGGTFKGRPHDLIRNIGRINRRYKSEKYEMPYERIITFQPQNVASVQDLTGGKLVNGDEIVATP